MTDGIILRRLETQADYDQAVALQEDTWGAGFTDRVPAAILRVAQKVGGVSAGAFDARGRLLGFVFGLTGVRDGHLVHWSDMLAVRQEARGRHLGQRLKEYQRSLVRALGVEVMYWTFDPLVARNAHFNLNRLGACIAEYVPDMYGSNTGSALAGPLPTDRFVAEWKLVADAADSRTDASMRPTADSRRDRVIAASHPAPHASGLGVPAPLAITTHDARVEVAHPLPEADMVHLPIPSDIERVLASAPDAALEWRLATREAFLHYLSRGYRVCAFDRGDAQRRPAYELTRTPRSSE